MLKFGENGIDTNLQKNVSIFGPGLVTKFNSLGIVVSGNNSMVEGVAITSICLEGIRVLGSQNEVEGNSISRAGLDNSLVGHFSAGIFVAAGNNRILNNEVVGAGTYPIISGQGGFGIFVGEPGAPSDNNLIFGNAASGNPAAGIDIQPGSIGNTVSHNQALGNIVHGDIFDANNPGANTYDDNLCEVSQIGGASGPNICELPNIAGHRNGPVDRN
jgi:parallel beta-helix repeat protein